ncbi:hypothetical protein KC19_2G100000 [Ceratodon purpureus]|uniref:BTB domain-containing protein n=1 Tax=Ceratodon purpureus TaxID=3225 RepID=A0A8T0IV51_CERPU|nr:hypothetical protein KC19_2G100000 [Ceratodon purpureus]
MAPVEDSSLKALSADFLDLLDKGQAFSDVTFNVEDRQVYAHRCVLAARSPFFRMIFCGNAQQLSSDQPRPGTPRVIPVGIVGYEVFMLMLQFLYSGNFAFSPQNSGRLCKDKSCYHMYCSSAVEFGLEMLNAAVFFGVEQLSTLTQKHLGAMAENASIEDVMRMLVTARRQEDLYLWNLCSKLVAKSGLSSETLRKHNLPPEIVWELESIRQKTGYGFETSMAGNGVSEQKTKRMQKALDSSDVELVKLMVMGEGLNLDKAFALHYAVSSCSKKVVKTLLDLGAANVNLRDPEGRTPLHIAAQLGEPEKIAMLLDRDADPHIQSATGATAMDIVQSGATEILSAGGYNSKGDHNRLRNCLELLERAVVISTPPMYMSSIKLGNGSPASILTEHGSSTLLPEESDNFQSSINRLMGNSNQGVLQNNDVYATLSHGLSGKVHGREPEGGETSDSIARLLHSNSLAFDFSEPQLQAESRNLTGNYSMLDSSSLDDRPRKMQRVFQDLKELPVLREALLKDFSHEAIESFKSAYNNPIGMDEEVSSGWQFFLKENSEAR